MRAYTQTTAAINTARRREGMLDAALALGRVGLAVFPVWAIVQYGEDRFACCCAKSLRCDSPGKHPMARLAPHGLNDATMDPEQIKHFWTCAPNANIGVRTGPIVVLDVDVRHGGDQALAKLEQRHGALPPSWRATTGGGLHVYFAATGEVRNSAGKIGEGLDVRGAGGCAIAPPSLHISGKRYVWERPPEQAMLAPLPAWLLAAARHPQAPGLATPAATWRELVRNGVGEGGRNDALTRLAGHLLRRDVDPLVTLEILSAWNAARCRPPLAESKIASIVARIGEREMRRRGEA
jgi:hypothetical protein